MPFPSLIVRTILSILTFILHLILVVIMSLSVASTGGRYEVASLALSCAAIFVILLFWAIQLLRRGLYESSNKRGVVASGAVSLIGLIMSILITIRVQTLHEALCQDFKIFRTANSCSIAVAVLWISWVAACTAVFGFALCCVYDLNDSEATPPAQLDIRVTTEYNNNEPIILSSSWSAWTAAKPMFKNEELGGWDTIPF